MSENLTKLFEDFRSDVFPHRWRKSKPGFTKEWRGFLFHMVLNDPRAGTWSWTYSLSNSPDADVVESNGVVRTVNLAMAACFCKWVIEQKIATREEAQVWWGPKHESIKANHDALKQRMDW